MPRLSRPPSTLCTHSPALVLLASVAGCGSGNPPAPEQGSAAAGSGTPAASAAPAAPESAPQAADDAEFAEAPAAAFSPEIVNRPWTGDFDGMVKRRMIRVLTPYSRTQYFIDKGEPRGIVYDAGIKLEEALNTKLKLIRTMLGYEY